MKVERDPLYRAARVLFYAGLFFSSLLVVRVGVVTVADVLLLGSIMLAGAARLVNRDLPWPTPHVKMASTLGMLMLLAVGGLLSAGNAKDAIGSTAVVVRLVFVMFVLPWLARILLPHRESLATAAKWLVAGAAFSASGTLLQFYVGPHIIPGSEVTNVGRFAGWEQNVSDLGGIGAMGFGIGVGFALAARRLARVIAIVGIGLLSVGLVLSGSVSGMLASAVALFVYSFRRALQTRYVVMLVLVFGLVLYVASRVQSSVSALGPVGRLLQTLGVTAGGRYSTVESRFGTYQAAWEQLLANPVIGRGFDSSTALANGNFAVHDLLLGAAFQGGLLVSVAVLAMAVRPIHGGWLRNDHSMLATQFIAGFAGVWVFALTAPSLYNRYFWVPVALLGACRVVALEGDKHASAAVSDQRTDDDQHGVNSYFGRSAVRLREMRAQTRTASGSVALRGSARITKARTHGS